MPIVKDKQYRFWLKSAANMKLSSHASVMRITYEVLDFNFNIIESLLKYCSKNIDGVVTDVPNRIASKNDFLGANIRIISNRILVVPTNSVKYYTAIRRTLDFYKYALR